MDSDYDISDNENKFEQDISRGPLRVENIDQIPILRDMFERSTTATSTEMSDIDLFG